MTQLAIVEAFTDLPDTRRKQSLQHNRSTFGGRCAWALLLPESGWVVVLTSQGKTVFARGDVAKTQIVLAGFSVAVNELLD